MSDQHMLDAALETAHLPALMAALVQISGTTESLKPEWKPTYTPFVQDTFGASEADMAAMRSHAKAVISAYLASGGKPIEPDSETMVKMMDFVAGAEIPSHYKEFLFDEMSDPGQSSKDPRWETAEAKERAAGLNVVIIGAGMSGLLTGIRLHQAGIPFTILEKNQDVGGTWLENTYPGCRVDSSNHVYSYSFEPNPAWPNHFSPQPVLKDYFRSVADKYSLKASIRFGTEVDAMTFDEASQSWTLEVTRTDGTRDRITANAVISAVGQLNQPKYPDIPGFGSFTGPAFHSSRWDHRVDLTNKRVGVIGTGASAYQFVPEIAAKVAHLTVFQRTPPWGIPLPSYHEPVDDGMKWALANIPYYARWYRFYLFWSMTDGFIDYVKADADWTGPSTAVGAANAEFRDVMVNSILEQTQDRPDLRDKLIPQYPPGGKRALMDNGVWISTLKRDNVELSADKIIELTAKGARTADGVEHEFDVLIYGTGFQASNFLHPMKIFGKGGKELHEVWSGDPRAYLGMTIPDFPNLFVIYGPNTNIVVNGSIVFFSECSVRYITGCLQMLVESKARSLAPRDDITRAFNERVDAENLKMAWGAPQVNSWYKGQTGRVTQNWPFPLVEYWRATLKPDPADFVIS
jgi:4-hydroxyacetophenone monooxygenase